MPKPTPPSDQALNDAAGRSGPETQGSWFGGNGHEGEASTVAAGAHQLDKAAPSSASKANRGERRPPSFFRIYRAFLTARAVLAILLIAITAGAWLLGNRPSAWVLGLTLSYSVLTLMVWSWAARHPPKDPDQRNLKHRQALATIGIDLTAFAWLNFLTSSNLNSQALLALPVLMAAILMPRIMSLGVAAAATLNLLAAAWLQSAEGGNLSSLMTQAGLTGFGLFAVAVMGSELAGRLAREERTAKGSLELARQQAQLNRLVIEEMAEGVMVTDRQGRVRTANPAARRLLAVQGSTPPPPFQLRGVPAWRPLVQAVEQAFANPLHADVGQELSLRFDDQSSRALRLRVRFTKGRDGQAIEDVCVMFIEDLRTVLARQRQDKLAAMGRMSAGIAHEIRNPLSAIAQANALLGEDATTPTQKRLTQMVADNVARLKNIIDDVLAVAPGLRPPAPAIDLLETVAAICNEWRQTQGLATGPDSLCEIDLSACKPQIGRPAPKVRFEPDHLHRVLVNLLDNALRHNSGQAGAILVTLQWQRDVQAGGPLVLSVRSDGEIISHDTEQSLFEPFFSTRSRGTGLGLYICRELCERHGASIDYRQHPGAVRHRNEFFVTMPLEPSITA
ncbi:nitrogen regulation protein NR(II) [Aquabacterium sp. CECT 9606]|uniref:two-component system sensor histidine kinase NtrB n=1 Tax=Aquabacterium sp. CECT 9606 TaxID=2845822 RepID=UPI001E603CEF|nr:ATP-binding protein [Aquabacterium sp. CECT 9606]CAH0349494.1 Adaptive-response sensory-kinase SasA [Aquabacterium sp. CECT 9606]